MKKAFHIHIPCRESHILETIEISKSTFLAGESENTVSRIEFLHQQSKHIKKCWWFLQGILLLSVCILLHSANTPLQVRRSLGLAGPAFVILIIPELWKNRSSNALEIECTTFYSLRQIYAARLTLFAGVDVLLLTLFFAGVSISARLTLWELVIQFLLPFNVTCCICFHSLYSKWIRSEALSMLLCTVFAGLWSLIVLNDAVYHAVSVPIWAGLLSASTLYFTCILFHGQRNWRNTMEVKPLWS